PPARGCRVSTKPRHGRAPRRRSAADGRLRGRAAGDRGSPHAGRRPRERARWRRHRGARRHRLPPPPGLARRRVRRAHHPAARHHVIADQPIGAALPDGPGSDRLRSLMDRGAEVVRQHPVCEARRAAGLVAPNGIWLWGQGTRRTLPPLRERFGVEGSVVAAADLVRGLGALAGLRVIDVPGATGQFDTNFRGKAEHGLRALEERDFLLLHVEAPDEGGHLGDAEKKVEAIERLDEDVLSPLLEGLRARGGEWRVMVLADHATPCARRTHTTYPVPFSVYVSAHDEKTVVQKRGYHERDAREQGIFVP